MERPHECIQGNIHHLRHNEVLPSFKPLQDAQGQIHVAGTECPAWSAQGLHEGVSGERVLAWLAWLGQRRKIRELIVVHENVGEFPLALLQEELGMYYIIEPRLSQIVCSSQLGQPYERVRRWSILINKELVIMHPRATCLTLASWPEFYERSKRTCVFDWQQYFENADPGLLRAELKWSGDRRKLADDRAKPPSDRPRREEHSEFDTNLNDIEIEWRDVYKAMGGTSVCLQPWPRPEGEAKFKHGQATSPHACRET